jgi:hypothetical protein
VEGERFLPWTSIQVFGAICDAWLEVVTIDVIEGVELLQLAVKLKTLDSVPSGLSTRAPQLPAVVPTVIRAVNSVDETKVILEAGTVETCEDGDCSFKPRPVWKPEPVNITVWGFAERGTGLGLTEVIVTGA